MQVIKTTLKIALPCLVIAGALLAGKKIRDNQPEPFSRPSQSRAQAVEATRLAATTYPVVIRSQGTVTATVNNNLVAEVAGSVMSMAPGYVVGGEFRKGEVLVQIDQRDYEIALTRARANLAEARARLREEEALAERAADDWKSLGRRGTPSELTLRKPQMAAASASLAASRAEVNRAELDLERTQVVAPYDGLVAAREAEVGQFVARGAPLGQIHALDSVDVRLPLSNRQLTYLKLPNAGSSSDSLPNVELRASVGGVEQIWTGKLIRAEGVDAETQQLTVVARVENPYADPSAPLRVGQYVEALIAGQVLDNVYVVPRSAVREEREVLIVDEDSKLIRRAVNVAWSDEVLAAINTGLNDDEILVLTPLSSVTDGTPVRATVDGVAPPPLQRRREGQGQGNGGNRSNGQASGQNSGRPEGQRNEGKPADKLAPGAATNRS